MKGIEIKNNRISDWLLFEECDIGRYSRSNCIQAINLSIECGSVVSKNSAGEITPFTGAGSAVGVAINSLTTTSAVTQNVILARFARIAPSALVWGSAITAAQKTAALADLAAIGIITVSEI